MNFNEDFPKIRKVNMTRKCYQISSSTIMQIKEDEKDDKDA